MVAEKKPPASDSIVLHFLVYTKMYHCITMLLRARSNRKGLASAKVSKCFPMCLAPHQLNHMNL